MPKTASKAKNRTEPQPGNVTRVLKEQIRSGVYADGEKLPSIRALSNNLKVSTRTVRAGVGELVAEGLLVSRNRSGLYARNPDHMPAASLPPDPDPKKSKSSRIADDIVSDIANGAYKSGTPLPLRKTLQFRYKTSGKTLQKALATVEARGVIHRKGNIFQIGSRGSNWTQAGKFVLCLGKPLQSICPLLPRLESELNAQGVLLSSTDSTDPAQSPGTSHAKSANCLGFLHALSAVWTNTAIKQDAGKLTRGMQILDSLGVPVCIVINDLIPHHFPNYKFRQYENLTLVQLGASWAGKLVAEYLISFGHTRVAYFSFADHFWDEARYRDLKNAFSRIWGSSERVERFTGARDERTRRDALVEHKLSRFRQSVNRQFPFLDDGQTEPIAQSALSALVKDSYSRVLKPLFESALANSLATVWVASDPCVAAAARDFLAEKMIDVPRQISLISIDTDDDTLSRHITSCDLQYDLAGYLAAHCLLGDIPIPKNRSGIVEHQGRILERGTVGRV